MAAAAVAAAAAARAEANVALLRGVRAAAALTCVISWKP